jgi:hypothetical protein
LIQAFFPEPDIAQDFVSRARSVACAAVYSPLLSSQVSDWSALAGVISSGDLSLFSVDLSIIAFFSDIKLQFLS